MIRKLRQKFVTVTMLFMSVTFGIIFTLDNIYSKYWDEQDTLDTLEWYADSDSFFEFEFDGEEMPEPYGNPVFAINLTDNLEIRDIRSSSTINKKAPSAEEIQAIFRQPPDHHKWKSYLYLIADQEDGFLLVITNRDQGREGVYRKLGNALLILAGFLILLLISFILSKFVTEPAKRALEREKQFISDASHELKTPLAAISINAQALQPVLPGNKHLQYILSETDRMDGLIQKLLKLSYMEETGSQTEKLPFSLSQCCEEMILSLESVVYERKIQFRYELDDNILYTGNEDDIKQLIAILLDNAIKHTPELGTIIFELKKTDDGPVIMVENSGEGISPDDLPHIFERFYRTDKARKSESNSYGLGLAIAKAILDLHNASVEVSSAQDRGVCFTIRF